MEQNALVWWDKLPLYNMDKINKRILAARYYQTEQSLLTNEQIQFIYEKESSLLKNK